MRKTFLAIASALLVLAATSCKKETENDLSNRPVRFTATIEESQNDDKTQLSGYNLVWQEGDEVAVVCTGVTSKEIYLPQNAGRQVGFVYGGDMANEPTLETPIKGAYPAEYFSDDLSTITLPCHQNYVANSMEKFPMYGETETHGINFKNMCGVLRVRLVKPGENVTKIAVTTTTHINGTYSVSMNSEGLPVMEHVSDGTNGDTLYCAEPVSIDNATNFYIYLPAGSYSPMRIEVFNDRGLLCSMESTVAINIERNKITTVAPPASKLNFQTCTGLITVNANGDQVRFAQGNLIYDNGTWKIAEHEYDVFKEDGYDQFRWSTGVNNNYGLGDADVTNAFGDWGINIGENYRTLTAEEWGVVLYSGGLQPYGRHQRYTRGKIQVGSDIYYGYIIMPDNRYAISGAPRHVTNFTTNVYTYEQWQELQAQGVAFMPIAKNGTSTSPMWRYWTASENVNNTNNAHTQNVSASANGRGDYPKSSRQPVRLVQPYEPLVISGSSSTELK